MLLNREGYFHAIPEVAVNETGPNNLATAVIKYRISGEVTEAGDVDVSDEGFEITGFHYMEKKDGSLNQMTLDALKASLGWNGSDLAALQDADYSEHPVTIKAGFETYNSQPRIKVQYLNPFGQTNGAGPEKADATKLRTLTGRLGSKLRAMNGGTPRQAVKPVGRPAATAVADCTAEDAWAAFLALKSEKLTQEHLESEWGRIWGELVPGKDESQMTAADWAKLRDEGPGRVTPF